MDARKKELAIMLLPALAAGLAAVIVSAAVPGAAPRIVLQTIAVAAILVTAWRAAVAGEQAGEEAAKVEQAPVVVQRITGDRRRPTFDRESGLLADWYFRLRVEEEIARAQRYGQKFTLLRMSYPSGASTLEGNMAARKCLRAIDLAGNIGDTTAIILPNTERTAAVAVIDRLRELAPEATIEASECPADGTTVGALLGEHEWTTGTSRADGEDVSAA
jgi:GGDEF domain-containing protein